MPRCEVERVVKIELGDVALGDVNLATIPPTASTQKSLDYEGVNNANIPLGASKIEIRPIDTTANAAITINGVSYGYNDVYLRTATLDPVNNNMDYAAAATLVSNGFKYKLSVIFPSSNGINVSNIIQ